MKQTLLNPPFYVPTCVQAVAENTFDDTSGTRRRTRLLKAYLGDGSALGRVGLLITTIEQVDLGDNRIGLITRIEEAPPSRHLTKRPTAHGEGNANRKSTLAEQAAAAVTAPPPPAVAGGGEGATAESAAAQGQGKPFIFPGFASVPALDPAALRLGGNATGSSVGSVVASSGSPERREEQQQQQQQQAEGERARPQTAAEPEGAAIPQPLVVPPPWLAQTAAAGGVSPFDALDLWAFPSGHASPLPPPPFITPDIMGVFEEEEEQEGGHSGW